MNLKLDNIRINNILLKEFDCDDIKRLYEIGSNPNMCKYLNWGPYKNINEAILIAKEIFLKRPEEGLPVGYSIFYKNYMVGMIDFHTYHKNDNSIEIGYFLDENYWGLGIMTKSLKKCIEYTFNNLKVDRIILSALKENERSLKLINKFNFKYLEEKMIDLGDHYGACKYFYLDYKDCGCLE